MPAVNLRHIEIFHAVMTAGNLTEAARLLHTSQPTVSRELARNGRRGRYGACKAQERAEGRRKACRPRRRLDDPALMDEVRRRIVDDRWSPEQVDGRMRLAAGRCVVSFSTVYRAVAAGLLDLPCDPVPVRRRLRRKGRRPRRGREETRGRIKVPVFDNL